MLSLPFSPVPRGAGPGPIRALTLPLRAGPPPTLLCVSRDPGLLETRAAVLARSGCAVVSAGPEEAYALAATRRFDLAVLGHTLTDEEAAALAMRLRSGSPRIKLLATCRRTRCAEARALFDALVESGDGPVALLAAVHKLLEGETEGDGGAGRDRTGA